MPRNGSGEYIRTDGVRVGSDVFQQEEALAINIEANLLDVEAQDMADALTQSIARDGQTNPTANLPMAGFNHTNVSNPTALNQYETLGNSYTKFLPPVLPTGTVNALVATYSPALTSATDNQVHIVISLGPNNVTNPTFDAGPGPGVIFGRGGAALELSDLGNAGYPLALVRRAAGGYELLNPYIVANPNMGPGAVALDNMVDMVQARVIGRAAGAGNGDPQHLTPAQVAAIIANEVGQSQLKTAIGDVSHTGLPGTSLTLVLPGGEYGFYPQTRLVSTDVVTACFADLGRISISGGGDTGYATRIRLQIESGVGTTGGTMHAQQRYVTASPPCNLGDGDVDNFTFIRMNDSIEHPEGIVDGIVSIWSATVPPWYYNGPTDLKPVLTFFDDEGIEHKYAKEIISQPIPPWEGGNVEDWKKGPVYTLREIDHDLKNADMEIFPHPFLDLEEGDYVVLLEPTSQIMSDLAAMQERGEASITELLHKGHLVLGDEVECCKPPGVIVKSVHWNQE